MNWKQGLWRGWIVISALWFLIIVAFVILSPRYIDAYPMPNGGTTNKPWDMIWSDSEKQRCAEARSKNENLGNPFACFEPRTPDYGANGRALDVGGNAKTLLVGGLVPPLLLLLLGLAGCWIVGGFRQQSVKSKIR